LVDDKKPKELAETGIEDAEFYANCLIEKGYDIRIVIGYNGKDCIFKTYDSEKRGWFPLYINGEEIKAFPSKELVELIYRYKNIHNIVITQDDESINISKVINKLKEIYRNVPHIQNDNQKTIDFTISFIALKSILEKHGSDLDKNWDDFKITEQKKLKEKIKTAVDDVVDNLKNGYEEIFKIEEDKKGKITAFNFLDEIKQFPSEVEVGEKGHLVKIVEAISELPYLHSSKVDIFGEIYQSLMNKSTRKIFGQFFTPRHLIKTLIRLFYEDELNKIIGEVENNEAKSPKIICDPACGTGGFLTESFKYIASNVNDLNVINLAKKIIYGFDIYPANAIRSRINMYLAGDGFSKIEPISNSLKYEGKQFDYILTNPPFGKGDYNVDSNIISNKRKEVNFLLKIVKILKEDGKALIIVPDGILEATNLSPLREWLIKNCIIEKIIGLPKHEFAPYTHEKTYVLFLKKRMKPVEDLDSIKTERIWMYIIDCDGYANSDKRFRTDKVDKNNKWLHDEISIWKNHKGAFHVSLLEECWKKKIQSSSEKYTDEWGIEKEGLKYNYVNMTNILEEEYTGYKQIKATDVLKIIKEITDSKVKVADLFDSEQEEEESEEKQLKEEYSELLEEKNIFYDPYEDKFFNKSIPTIKKLLKLIPEKYLRQKKIETISFEEFKKQNAKIEDEIKKEIIKTFNLKEK